MTFLVKDGVKDSVDNVEDGEKIFNTIVDNREQLHPDAMIPVIRIPKHVKLDKNAIPVRYRDYPHDLYELHKEKRVGDFEIRKFTIPIGKALQFYTKELGMCRCIFKTPYKTVQLHQIVQDGKVLSLEDGVWMSDTPMEFETTDNATKLAKGDVLECGLGIGLFTYYASKKESVKSITTIEKEKDIIDLVYPVIQNKKTKVINADAIEFLKTTNKKFDTIHIDIWAGILHYKEFEPMIKLARTKLKPNGIVTCWLDDNWKKIKKDLKKGIMKNNGMVINGNPCLTCGKTTRFDFGGFCMDCADGLGMSDFGKKILRNG